MTPRRLDWRAVQPKLQKIDELLGRLHQLGEFDEKRLQTDHVDALAVERILTLVVDLAFAVNSHAAAARLGRAPDTYAESFTLAAEIGLITTELGAALAPSAGTRNVLVHGYLEIDYREWGIQPHSAPDSGAGRRHGMTGRVLYLIVCAAGPASRIDVMVKLAQHEGWSVYCLATPAAVEHYLDVAELATLTGHPVRITYRTPGGESLPRADAVVVAPATYNTIRIRRLGVRISSGAQMRRVLRAGTPFRVQRICPLGGNESAPRSVVIALLVGCLPEQPGKLGRDPLAQLVRGMHVPLRPR